MRDQPAVSIDDERNAPGTDPYFTDDIPYELEIDLGDHDAGGPALAGKRDREVRFRSVAETNAAIVDLTGQRREICRIL